MSRLSILTDSEQREFDYPPVLSLDTRALCFNITADLEKRINRLRTNTNKVGFLLQYGYFKACKRFFVINRFRQEDIEYTAKVLGISLGNIDFSQYKKKIPADHKIAILKLLEYRPFEGDTLQWIGREIIRRVECFTDPRTVFLEVLDLLHRQHIEIPSYYQLSELITQHYLNYEEKLLKIIDKNISLENRTKLNSLLNIGKNSKKGTLAHFSIINQSSKPKAIQESLGLFNQLKECFFGLLPIIGLLNLSAQSREYYAVWLKKAKLSQIKQIADKNKLYLHLIAFIQNQFYLAQDAYVDILLRCVQSSKNALINRLDASDKLTRSERRAAISHLSKSNRSYRSLIDDITLIARSTELSNSEKVRKINELIDENEKNKVEIEQAKIELFEKSIEKITKNQDYFDVLEKLSIKLQNRISGIIKALEFNEANSNKDLMTAINHFKTNDGKLKSNAPSGFLCEDEKEALANDKTSFRPALYKILLFIAIANAIKSGDLNLKYSYRYLSIQEYLIDKIAWRENRNNLIKDAGLEDLADYNKVMNELKRLLNEKYEIVNQRFLEGRNPYLSIHEDGHVQVTTPALDEKDMEYISALLNQGGYIPILRVLSEIDRVTKFTKCLKHHSIKNVKYRPNSETFFAGIIGLGCNIGVPKMAQISIGVNENTLMNVVNWYFVLKNLRNANQKIVEVIHKLVLSNVFIAEEGQLHSSSDGQKVSVAVESLLANYSFKYFGKDKGISVYTFIDERQALFHSLIMSTTEREAAYVIDGLNNNEVAKIDIHSTDTHGYTELIFATTHFLGVSFAPRLKNIGKQSIYAFASRKTYEKLGYKILPSRTIAQKLIEKHWDDILRFMVTIKLKNVTASQLFKRLSSYAKDNPLYKAIKELGRIIKSLFILTYFDDVRLRQRIEKQLNRVETSNRFSKAVFYANSSEFKQGASEEQEIAVACKVLIQNAIVLWNYLYLSQLLANCKDDKERNEMIELIKDGSILNWHHINLHGEFNFNRANGENIFDMNKIFSLKLNIKVA